MCGYTTAKQHEYILNTYSVSQIFYCRPAIRHVVNNVILKCFLYFKTKISYFNSKI